jgi:guanine nucleotide-binding protein G(i) subunit alpha
MCRSRILIPLSTAQAQRKILLHKSRQIRKEDAANLRTLSSSSGLNGACITGLAQLSRFIQWLRLLFHMKLARNEFNGAVSPTDEENEEMAAATRSEAIDRALQREATNLRHETKLVLVGNTQSGKELIMHQLKVLFTEGYHSTEERLKYRPAIYQVIHSLIQSITNLLKDTGVTLSKELNHDFAILLHELDTAKEGITPDAVKAITTIWSCPEFSKLYVRNFEIDFPQYAPYFAQEAPRIADADYVPSEADIIRLNQSMRGINEARFNWDELDVHLFNIRGYVPQHFRERWYHQLDEATAVIYTVDVSLYNKPSPQLPDNQSILVHEFEAFETWVNQPGFAHSSIILILNNFSRFVSKMAYAPLEKLFPDYVRNESDPELSARQYLLKQFRSRNHQALPVYSFWVDLDSSDNQHLYQALKSTLSKVQQQQQQLERQRRAREEEEEEGGGAWGSSVGSVAAATAAEGDSDRPVTNGASRANLLSPSRSRGALREK